MKTSRHLLRAGLAALCLSTFAGAALAEKLKVGYLPASGHAKFFVAQEQGLFKQEGLEVELVEFVNQADGLHAVTSGKIDIGAFGTSAPLVHYSRGADLKVIGGIMGQDSSIVAKQENAAAYRNIADLKGKKIATVRLATGDAVLRGALKAAGLDWKTDVQIFELKNPPAVAEAVKSGQVDVGVTWAPHDVLAERQGLKVVIRSGELQPGHPCCRLVVKSARLNDQATLEKFVRAILKAEKFAAQNRKETIDSLQKYVKLDREILETSYYSAWLDQTSDPNAKGTAQFWETLADSGFIEGNRDIKGLFAPETYRRALESLAKEEPNEAFWRERIALEKTRNTL
ncbi:ABC transporter substrate-binding protein [Pseudothauera nasutitermitis]|uniref:ABC transporter substrate-binding protein n=1 Tax=Pseudothauera nasutitermitis TaxID=2565930 RepID=A0A4S4B3P0_9RHOO|nr:ABC transporter substrate-binding protein [Pseudothauera nasutitermitis]THF67298.1 ABC transporter substrate-binding protein [Pseudothauera nasutitermitis]